MIPRDRRFAEDASELLTREEILSMSGMEFIGGICEGRLPGPPICRTLGFWMHAAEEGRVVFRGEPSFGVMNPIGTVHGGWFGALLDSCMACAVQTLLPRGRAYTTLEYRVNVLRPLTPGSGTVEAVGTAVHAGRRTGVAEGRLVGVSDGRLYATGSTTCLVFEAPSVAQT